VQAGRQLALHAFRIQVQLPVSLVNQLLGFGQSSLSGNIGAVDFDATDATPAVINAAASPLPFGPVALVANQPATFTVPTAPTNVGPWTAGSSGSIAITPGPIVFNLDIGLFVCTPNPPAPFATTIIR
jgi:hypothetical protein